MQALLLRDIVATRTVVLLGAPCYLLMAYAMYEEASAFFLITMVFSLMLALATNIVDDKSGVDAFFCCLPLSRSTLVRGRYLSSLLAIAAGTVTYVVYGAVLDRLLVDGDLASNLSWAEMVTFLSVPVLLVSLFYPIYYRLGFDSGAIVLVMILTILLLGVTDLLGLLGGSTGGAAGVSEWRDPVVTLIGKVGEVSRTVGESLFPILAMLSLGALVGCSMGLSIRLFRQRDL